MVDTTNDVLKDEIRKIEGRLEAIREVALNYLDKSHGEINENDIKKLEDLQRQSDEIRKMAMKFPFLGNLCIIAADLSVLLKRAILLMIENMKPKEKPVVEPIHVNTEGIKQSDNMARIYEATLNKVEGLGKDKEPASQKGLNNKRNRLESRSEYFGYESKKEKDLPDKNPNLNNKDDEEKMKERLEKYNQDVKKRGEANGKQNLEQASESSGAQSESSKGLSKD